MVILIDGQLLNLLAIEYASISDTGASIYYPGRKEPHMLKAETATKLNWFLNTYESDLGINDISTLYADKEAVEAEVLRARQERKKLKTLMDIQGNNRPVN